MQNDKTLMSLGFKRCVEWDFHIESLPSKEKTIVPHFKLKKDGIIFRAYTELNNGTPYVCMRTIPPVDNFYYGHIDCCSEGSVKRNIEKIMELVSQYTPTSHKAKVLKKNYNSLE